MPRYHVHEHLFAYERPAEYLRDEDPCTDDTCTERHVWVLTDAEYDDLRTFPIRINST